MKTPFITFLRQTKRTLEIQTIIWVFFINQKQQYKEDLFKGAIPEATSVQARTSFGGV